MLILIWGSKILHEPFEIWVQIGPFFISVPTIVAVSGVEQYDKNIALESSIPKKKYHQKAWKYN